MRTQRIRRILATGVVAAATGSVLLAVPAQAQEGGPETPAATLPTTPVAPRMTQGLDSAPRAGTPADAARAHLKAHETTYRVPVSELTTVRTTRSGAQSSVRFQQRRGGVPVFGAEYAVQTEAADGGEQVVSATGTLYPELTVSTTPEVSEAAARQRMFTLDPDLSGVEGGGTESHGLTVLPGSGGGRLAWHFTVSGAKADGSPVRQEVFVDAHVGGIALSYDNIDAAAVSPAHGTGVKVDGAEERIEIDKEADGSYTLVDSSRAMFAKAGGQIRTYDANRKSYLDVANGPVTEDVKVVSSPTDRFSGTATTSGAVDAHLNAGKVYEYFKHEVGRDGIDGKGGTIHSVVNVAQGGKDYANAFWDGTKMVYGHMAGVPLSVGLDVVGHEMTHGVTEHSAGLVYLNQSGALNEAISDYFGNAMETADKGVAMSDPTSGLIGEYLCNGTKPLAECALRDMNDGRVAGEDYLPASLDIDNGGVHLNSTIVSGALWDMRKSLDPALADKIVYRAAQNYLTPLSGFSDMRNAVTLAAKSLKVSRADREAIADAFDAHGIVEGWERRSGTQDGMTLARDVLPAYEVYSGVDEQAAQISGDVYAIGHGDPIAWNASSADFGITVGRFGKGHGHGWHGGSRHELAEKNAYLLDPSLDEDRIVFTRITPDSVGVYTARDQGKGPIRKLVDGPGDEMEPVTDDGRLAYIDKQGGESDVMLRERDGSTVNLTPAPGTTAARLTMKQGTVAWRDGDNDHMNVYDIATGAAQRVRIQSYIFGEVTDVQLTEDRVFWRETTSFLFRSDAFWSAPLGDLSQKKRIAGPSQTYGGQFSVNDTYFAYSTYDPSGALGAWTGKIGKVNVAPVADVVNGTPAYSRVSCSSGMQLSPQLGDGQRTVWLDTSAASTDVVTRESFAGTCA
ncbi:M4 family metallopeptidase [Streptomyces sp. Je 1-79]|uniref:M4 family metallopeptidase n=1 Tax=Streptomyces sp. Je 1-79 TaxID=2943847 RepID=UPI0021A6FD67|nr:M4 family metallopeptidase [Streptomyces sp. Je 1-79]MCT4352780.1 M4 family metallopeptidase [Streptomyces sp. Je 1-79]